MRAWRIYGPCGSSTWTLHGRRVEVRARITQIIGGRTWSLCLIRGIREESKA